VYTEREWQQHTAGLRIAADKVPMPYRLAVSFECWGIKGPAGKPYMTTAEVELVHGHRLPPLHTMDVRVYGAQPQESLEAGGSHLGQQIARDVIADWPGSRTAIDLVSTGLDQEVRKVLKKLQIGTYIQRPQQSSSDSRRWRLEANEMDAEKIVMRLRDSLPESSIEASHRDLITARFVIPPEKKLPQCFLRVSQCTLEDHIRLSKLLQKIPDTKAGHHGLKNGNVTHRITGLTAEQLIEYLSAELPELELSTPQDEVVSASFKAN
jgi:hypothetical protein